jgi:hypothetical protein
MVMRSFLQTGFESIAFARRANHHFRFSEAVSSEKSTEIENISLFPKGEQWHMIAIPSRSEGRIMIVTNVGRGAVDAGSADNERRESVR